MGLKKQLDRINQINNFLLIEQKSYLLEGRYEDLLKKYPEREGLIHYFWNNDPSPTKKYFTWMTEIVVKDTDSIAPDDLLQMVSYFDKNSQKFEKKDIYQYTLDEFVKSYEEAILKISKKELALSGVEKLYEDDKYLLLRPKNREASCKYGANTKWCISGNYNNYFDNYKGDNLFFFIIDKLRQPIEGKKKSSDYFKIAIQYEPEMLNWQNNKEDFLTASQIGDFTFWNAIDKSIKKDTLTKYIEKSKIKKFIDIIKDYTYKLYLNYYEDQSKKFNEFDEENFKIKKKLLNQKKRIVSKAIENYQQNECVIFVNKTNEFYINYLHYTKIMKISEKSLEEILDFKGIKNRYFECLQIKNSLDESLQQLNIEYSKDLLEYERLQIEKQKLNSTINFGDR